MTSTLGKETQFGKIFKWDAGFNKIFFEKYVIYGGSEMQNFLESKNIN